MSKKQNELSVQGPVIPEAIKNRLQEKMMDMNDTKVIDKLQQINAHKEAIALLNKEVEALISIGL